MTKLNLDEERTINNKYILQNKESRNFLSTMTTFTLKLKAETKYTDVLCILPINKQANYKRNGSQKIIEHLQY